MEKLHELFFCKGRGKVNLKNTIKLMSLLVNQTNAMTLFCQDTMVK
jgi:hypothetical protein